jgi:SSS family transporter
MSPELVTGILVAYFAALITMAYFTSRKADTDTFFTGNRQSPWYLVAFGMIGTSLSGVTFISVPGKVGEEGMAYFQIVIGYIFGYIVIAKVLMPLYYRMNLVSIYEYLLDRFGIVSYKTGAAFFVISRTLGSAIRLYLATVVLQLFLFDGLGVPYWVTACTTILLIWVYTFKGGVKTIVYTDAFQTIFLVGAVVLSIVMISQALDLDFGALYGKITRSVASSEVSMSKIIFLDDYKSRLFFPKQFLAGMFITIAMTGLDQDLMQKNLTCKSIGDAQKNMYSFTAILVACNFLFLFLGGALYVYASSRGIDLPMNEKGRIITDEVFPTLAFGNFGMWAGIFFLLGITASSYASADSALTALTTGFCIDFLNFNRREEAQKKRMKLMVHIGFSALFLLICLVMHSLSIGRGLIDVVLGVAGYTYGPLLGLFFFGILTKRKPKEALVPFICLIMPAFCWYLSSAAPRWFDGYVIGLEMILINGLLTFGGLWLISKKRTAQEQPAIGNDIFIDQALPAK